MTATDNCRGHWWSYMRSYYDINRSVTEWGLSRRAALISAWRCWWMIRPVVKSRRHERNDRP